MSGFLNSGTLLRWAWLLRMQSPLSSLNFERGKAQIPEHGSCVVRRMSLYRYGVHSSDLGGWDSAIARFYLSISQDAIIQLLIDFLKILPTQSLH
jgi:hypothetical protein